MNFLKSLFRKRKSKEELVDETRVIQGGGVTLTHLNDKESNNWIANKLEQLIEDECISEYKGLQRFIEVNKIKSIEGPLDFSDVIFTDTPEIDSLISIWNCRKYRCKDELAVTFFKSGS